MGEDEAGGCGGAALGEAAPIACREVTPVAREVAPVTREVAPVALREVAPTTPTQASSVQTSPRTYGEGEGGPAIVHAGPSATFLPHFRTLAVATGPGL